MSGPIQRVTGTLNNPTSFTITLDSAATECNLLLLAIAMVDPPGTTTVTDSQGNTWVSILKTDNGAGATLETFMAGDVAGGAETITVSFSSPPGKWACIVEEFSGVAPVKIVLSAVDQKVGAYGSSGNPSAGSVTTSQSDELIWNVAALLGTATLTPGSGNTAGDTATAGTALQITDSYRDSAAATYTDGWTGAGSIGWLAQTVSFIECGASGPTAPDTAVDGGEDNSDPTYAWADANGVWGGDGSSGVWDNTDGAYAGMNYGDHNTNTLKLTFNAGDFAIPGGAAVCGAVVEFDASGNDDGYGDIPTVSEVKIGGVSFSAGNAISTDASIHTYTFGGPCGVTGVDFSASVELDLRFQCPVQGGGTQVNISNVFVTVYYYTPL